MLVCTSGRYRKLYNVNTRLDFYSVFTHGYVWSIILLYLL